MTETFGMPLNEILEVQVQEGMKGIHVGYMHIEWVKEIVQKRTKESIKVLHIQKKGA
jgi:hypothetical protein